ncbi:MAG: CmcJ/NvfI family oxidoreductase [Sphingomonadaceae bacterium]
MAEDRSVNAVINYAARTGFRQRYYANDHSRDTVVIDGHPMAIGDARASSPSLAEEGFVLVPHVSAVADFTDAGEVAARHPAEIVALLLEQTGADEVFVTSPGILRFSEASGRAGSLDNSMPARFAHVDSTAETNRGFALRSLPEGRSMRRYAHYNVWRTFSGAPQDVPLALCDARSVPVDSLMVADAIFDPEEGPEWGFDSWLVAHDSAHRWAWFPEMTRDEAIIFRTGDSDNPHPVPHVAFDNPLAPEGSPPRASIEMRAVAYWYD